MAGGSKFNANLGKQLSEIQSQKPRGKPVAEK